MQKHNASEKPVSDKRTDGPGVRPDDTPGGVYRRTLGNRRTHPVQNIMTTSKMPDTSQKFTVLFPPIPIMPEYDDVVNKSYTRETLQRFSQHVASIMIKHANSCMVPYKDMVDFPPPPMLPPKS